MSVISGDSSSYSRRSGIVAPDLGWTPPIRYLLRRQRILSLLETQPRGKLLEVGCGGGALLCDLTRMGYNVHGLETSSAAHRMASQLAGRSGSPHEVAALPGEAWEGSFDFVCAFDVLEHIEDDAQALEQWLSWMAPGGKLLLSVPAHRSRWSAGDVWAGHFRRYDRRDLLALVDAAGLVTERLECYGFPLANLTELLGNFAYRRMIAARANNSKAESTAESGIDRRSYSKVASLMFSLPGQAALSMAGVAQSLTLRTDWGSGYLLLAHRA
ncbi:MAG TPA: class I SAM-dependent methyltransferase [Luteimonas sp.]